MNDDSSSATDVVNEIYTIDEQGYSSFLQYHEAQIISNNIPIHFWKPLSIKFKHQIFDAGNTFSMFYIESEASDKNLMKVVVSVDSIDPADGNNIYLIDHAWTYKANEAKSHLLGVPGLVERMAKLMNLSLTSDCLVDDVCAEMWKFNQTYSCSTPSNIEDQLPVWYIMDEFGSAIQHSDNPNFRVVPFLNLSEGVAYSLMFPTKIVYKGEDVSRDFIEGFTDDTERKARLLPWVQSSFKGFSFQQIEPSAEYFLSSRRNETLPNLDAFQPKDANGFALDNKPLRVFSQYSYINEYLTSSKFSIVNNEQSADIIWLTSHFKQFKEFSESSSSKFINQFPFESVLTIKDLLAIVCRRNKGLNHPTEQFLLPTTYNLVTELPKFVSYFQYRQDEGLNNHWICKPWNLARGMDTLITDDLNCIVRLSSSGPKIAQKYIEDPVLFHRNGVGNVKFDIRYVILLKSVKPLEVYIYKHFFLRFANKPFELSDFHDYEKHFTVMNYNDNANLHRMLCSDFVRDFDIQYPDNKWSDVEPKILSMFYQVFDCATAKKPPCGIGENPQSRALYAADLMLSKNNSGEFEPKLLEINWCPDCQRACEYYSGFYNDIFELLFLDEEKDVFYKLSPI